MSASVFHEGARLNAWRELFGRQFLRLDIDPIGDEPFRHDISFLAMPDFNVSHGSVSAVRYEQTRDMLADASDNLTLIVPQIGEMELHEGGKEAQIGQGDALIRRSYEVGTTFSTGGEHLALMVSRENVARYVSNVDRFGFAVVQKEHRTLTLLKNYLVMLMGENSPTPLPDDELGRYTAEMISRHVHEVVGLLIGASRDFWEFSGEEGGGLFATRIAAIRAEVEQHAADPNFSVHDVARKLDISPGYIRKLLASRQQRFSDLLRSTRLDAAHRMLRAPHFRQVDITEIALQSGFNDISYFNRCFKQRFGMTPSDVRNGSAHSSAERS